MCTLDIQTIGSLGEYIESTFYSKSLLSKLKATQLNQLLKNYCTSFNGYLSKQRKNIELFSSVFFEKA